jgi:hypothetical protein
MRSSVEFAPHKMCSILAARFVALECVLSTIEPSLVFSKSN